MVESIAANSFADDAGPVRIAVLMACYNRKETTLRCLQRLFSQQLVNSELQLYLVDDNSPDGTAAAVRTEFPQAHVIEGTGGLYWNGGMRLAWQQALTGSHHFYLWLNDDVLLQPDAITRLLHCYQQQKSPALVGAVLGAMICPASGEVTYGGRRSRYGWLPLQMGPLLAVSEAVQYLDGMNGNCCLIPHPVAAKMGILSSRYTHAMGDYDYGFRLQKAGYQLLQAPGAFGQCAANGVAGGVRDGRLPLVVRKAMLQRPTAWPPLPEWQLFVRRHGGPLWPLLWLKAALRGVFPGLWLRSIAVPARELDERPRVVIVQQVLKQYRLPLFNQLQAELAQRGIALQLLFSKADGVEAAKADQCQQALPSYCCEVPLRRLGPLTWQSCPSYHPQQLVILEQANRHLLNYWLLLQRRLGRLPRLAWWGHGYHHQKQQPDLKDKIKRALLTKTDWFFAYTGPVAEYAAGQGMPKARISVLNNSLDTSELASQVRLLRKDRQAGPAGASDSRLVLLFCGALYPEKRIDLLLATADLLQQRGQLQRLIVLGDGPSAPLLQPAPAWLDYRGACFGADKARAYAEADFVLHPGLVGLAILDAFAAGVPFVCASQPNHSPEICYLEPGVNGVMTAATPEALADAIMELWQQPKRYQQLVQQAQHSAERYSLAAMVTAFSDGIQTCLLGDLA
ncbi:glycosyltransferase [Alkalimonas sp. NCh-2]|uniref:glycosyltransferase n=1 Tax=Alkalimonas sp. NCh-2 TaxID=3144846 RepID=UPI0031F6577C